MHSFLNNSMHGVGVLTYELIQQFGNKCEVVIVDRSFGTEYLIKESNFNGIRQYTIQSPFPDYDIMRDHCRDEYILTLLDEIFKKESFNLVNVHHLTYWPQSVIQFFKSKNLPIVLSVHDTYGICPTINYFNRVHHIVCSKPLRESTENNCLKCLQDLGSYRFEKDFSLDWYQTEIMQYREKFHQIFKDVDAIVYPTQRCKQYYTEEDIVHPVTKIIPYFIKIQVKPKVNLNRFTFGFISNIGFGKGLDILLNAFSLIKEDVSLKIFGEIHDPNIGNILNLAIKNDPRIEYKGPYKINDLSSVLAQIDVVVVPSYFPESFNLCSYASVTTKRLVIVSEIAYHKEFLLENSNCFVFKTGDSKELYKQMNFVCKNKIKNISTTSPNYGNKFGESYLQLYKSIIDKYEK